MIGAIAGDMIGSPYEGRRPPADFPLFGPKSRFTDDTVLAVAVADALRHGADYAATLHRWGRAYPHAGYASLFRNWLRADDLKPYGSFGNGSAMRVAAVGWAFDDLERVLAEAEASARVTHDHPEGIKGAQAVAAAVFLGRTSGQSSRSKESLRAILEQRFGYDCSTPLAVLRKTLGFDVTCQGTVPAAAVALLESHDFESAVRNAVSIGGDSDTLGCIAGAMAEAFYGGVPADIQREVFRRLDDRLRTEVTAFAATYGVPLSAADA